MWKLMIIFGLMIAGLFTFGSSSQAAQRSFSDSNNYLNQAADPTGIDRGDVKVVIGDIINNALLIVGLAFFILMFYGGFLWFTAHGKEDQVEKAKNIIIAAVIGIAVIVGAYAITNVVVGNAIKAGTG